VHPVGIDPGHQMYKAVWGILENLLEIAWHEEGAEHIDLMIWHNDTIGLSA